MKCKTCKDRGMMFKPKVISEREVAMEVVACDCCGGWSADGLDCENCKADAEERARGIIWITEEEFSDSMEEWLKKKGEGS